MVEIIKEDILKDKRAIEEALLLLRFGVRHGGGCHAVGGSFMGGMHGQAVKRDALDDANKVIRDADPATLEKVQEALKRKQYPTGADYADVI